MKNFQKIDIDLIKSDNVIIDYYESYVNEIYLLIKIQGVILDESAGSLDQ